MIAGLPDGADGILTVGPGKPPIVYLGADGYGVFRWTGKTWVGTAGASRRYSNGTSILSMVTDPVDGRTVYVDGILKSRNAGRSWQEVPPAPPWRDHETEMSTVHTLAIDPTHPTTLYAGADGGVFKSIDGGGSWLPTPIQPPKVRLPPLQLGDGHEMPETLP